MMSHVARRGRRGVFALAAAAVCLSPGCRDATGPARETRGLAFTVLPQLPPATAVAQGPGYVEVTGQFTLPCQPYPLAAAAVVTDSTVVLYVTGQTPEVTGGTTPACTPGKPATEQGYRARIGRLSARGYMVQVVHRWPGDPWVSTTVLTDTVQVP